jgi:hypothetical protein
MFTHIREAVRIVTSKPSRPAKHETPDYVIAPQQQVFTTAAGRRIAKTLQFLLVVLACGYVGGKLAGVFDRLTGQTRLSNSFPAVYGICSLVIFFLAHSIKQKLEARLDAHLNLSFWLSPYFGRRITNAMHTMRG